MKKNSKGFTLAELLIVVAIIAVLVAIAIPVFNASMERSREATDEANIRSLYGQLTADVLVGNTSATKPAYAASYEVKEDATSKVMTGKATYTMKQTTDGTESGEDVIVGAVEIKSDDFKTGTCTITITDDGNDPTIAFS